MRSQPLSLFWRYESRWWKCFVISDIREGLWSRASRQRMQSRSARRVRTAPKRKWPLLWAPTRPTGKVSQCWFMLIKMKKEKKKKSQELPHWVRCQSLVSVKKPQLFMSKVHCEWLKQCDAGRRDSYWVRMWGCLCSAFSPGIFPKAESVLFRTDRLSKWLRMRISDNSSSIICRFVFCSKFAFWKV